MTTTTARRHKATTLDGEPVATADGPATATERGGEGVSAGNECHDDGRYCDTYFGVCPTCELTDGYLNVGRAHFFVCHVHRVRWLIGDNLFSSWRFLSPDEWQANWDQIKEYEDILPYRPDAQEES